MRVLGFEITGRTSLWLLALPLALALTIDTVPKFVYASCVYYCTQDSSFEIQVSADGGANWRSDYWTVYPGETINLRVRLHVVSGELQGWQFSVKHDTSMLEYYGGSLGLNSAANGDGPVGIGAWRADTALRTDEAGDAVGFVHGVVLDNFDHPPPDTTLGPTSHFVTAQAMYTLTAPPTQNSTVTFSLVDDIGEGGPPIMPLATENLQSVAPCRCDFTLTVVGY